MIRVLTYGHGLLDRTCIGFVPHCVNYAFFQVMVPMKNTSALPADGIAEQIVRHFQAEGFSGISEALIVRICSRGFDRKEVEAEFKMAAEQERMPPVHEHLEVRPHGHFAGYRSFAAAKASIQSDFGINLRMELPSVLFDPAPVVVHDVLATGTKYDAMIKLQDNVDGYAFAVLLNDPDSSFFEYLGTHHGNDWQKIVGNFETTAVSFTPESDLL